MGINPSIDDIKQTQKEFGLTYCQVIDADHRMSRRLRVISIPRTFLIDKRGIIVADMDGFRGESQLLKALKKVGL